MNVSSPLLVAYFPRYLGYLSHNYWTVSGETLKNTIIYQYKSISIKKSPNFEKKFFAVFRKTSKSIAHKISKFSRKTLRTEIG
ncbi:hypothetical protein T11_9622 [Trichinella zimbabwensis]|uniref:Uncharacterized protein n=1 Tax=Trichinella zimbabwensis TaxID=268475 RepID=A0A0V1GBG7_9BILA|nr:hypothetical protein T11_9622 [Trichinella zimbabwensis]